MSYWFSENESKHIVSFEDWKCSILLRGGNENSFMAFFIWSLEFWWLEYPSKEEYGNGTSWNFCSVSSLWRMCCWKTTSFKFPNSKPWRFKEVLGPLHSNVCGLLTPISNGGKGILLPLMMIIRVRLRCIFWKKIWRLLMYLKASKYVWRMRLEGPLRTFR